MKFRQDAPEEIMKKMIKLLTAPINKTNLIGEILAIVKKEKAFQELEKVYQESCGA